LTVIVTVLGMPTQPFAVGVTVIIAIIGFEVALTAEKAAILPVPLPARPMLVVLFTQLYVVPETPEPPKVKPVAIAPLQTVWLVG
jgi:hypothetical protein